MAYNHHTANNRQYCYVGKKASECKLGLFRDADIAGDVPDSKSTSSGVLCIFGSDTCYVFQYRGLGRSKPQFHIAASQAEINSLDAGLRMEAIPTPGLVGHCDRRARTMSSGRSAAKKEQNTQTW